MISGTKNLLTVFSPWVIWQTGSTDSIVFQRFHFHTLYSFTVLSSVQPHRPFLNHVSSFFCLRILVFWVIIASKFLAVTTTYFLLIRSLSIWHNKTTVPHNKYSLCMCCLVKLRVLPPPVLKDYMDDLLLPNLTSVLTFPLS